MTKYVETLCRTWSTEGHFSACPNSEFLALCALVPSWAVEVVQVSLDRAAAGSGTTRVLETHTAASLVLRNRAGMKPLETLLRRAECSPRVPAPTKPALEAQSSPVCCLCGYSCEQNPSPWDVLTRKPHREASVNNT